MCQTLWLSLPRGQQVLQLPFQHICVFCLSLDKLLDTQGRWTPDVIYVLFNLKPIHWFFFIRCYLGPAITADEVEIAAGEYWRSSNLQADWAFQLLLLSLDLAVDELKQLQVRL